MQVLITGGNGLIGKKLCREIISAEHLLNSNQIIEKVKQVILWDSGDSIGDGQESIVKYFKGDICDSRSTEYLFKNVLDPNLTLSVFHLASMMSGQGEQQFDECFRVNLEATKQLLDSCRNFKNGTKFIFTSSIGAVGPANCISTTTRPMPQSTYGVTKAMSELLVSEYARRRFVDGRVCRMPTVMVRPGPPNAATTASFNNIVKAVMEGLEFISPIPMRQHHPVIGLKTAAKCLLQVHNIPLSKLEDDPVINIPAVTTCLSEIEEVTKRCLRSVGKGGIITMKKSREQIDPLTAGVFSKFAVLVDDSRAVSLGIEGDRNLQEIIKEYFKDIEM